MISCSRLVLGFLNVVALTFSIFQIICSLINEHHSGNNKQYYCYKSPSDRVILLISYFLLIMSLLGLMSSFCKSYNALQLFYLWVVLISAIVAVTATVFMFAVLPNASPASTWHKASQNGNWINEFSPLLRGALVNEDKWFVIKSCLADSGLCETFRNPSRNPILEENLRFLELGCCIPPRRCGLMQKNETQSGMGVYSEEEINECKKWWKSKKYCYDCDSCKAGYLSKFQRDWKAYKGIYIGLIVILIIATFLSCYSFNQKETQISAISKAHDQRIV